MNARQDSGTDHDRIGRVRAIIELVGVATLTVTHIVSAATAVTAATRRRRTCR